MPALNLKMKSYRKLNIVIKQPMSRVTCASLIQFSCLCNIRATKWWSWCIADYAILILSYNCYLLCYFYLFYYLAILATTTLINACLLYDIYRGLVWLRR